MEEVSISELSKCLALLEQVKRQKPLRITRHGKARRGSRASLVGQGPLAWIGSMKDRMDISAILFPGSR